MKLSTKIGAVSAMILAPLYCAHSHPHSSFDFVSLGIASVDEDLLSDRYQSYGGLASISLTNRLFTQIGYMKTQDDLVIGNNVIESDFATFSLGLGYRFPIGHASEWYIAASLSDVNGSVSAGGQMLDLTGESYSATVGYVIRLSDFELGAALYHAEGLGDANESGIEASIRYYLSEHTSIDLSGDVGDEVKTLSIALSYHF